MGGMGTGARKTRLYRRLPIHRRAALETGWLAHSAPVFRLASDRAKRYHETVSGPRIIERRLQLWPGALGTGSGFLENLFATGSFERVELKLSRLLLGRDPNIPHEHLQNPMTGIFRNKNISP